MTTITAGVDIGSTGVKAVLFDGSILARSVLPTGWSPAETGERALADLLLERGLRRTDLARVTATGYGRKIFREADDIITEITCHAAGAFFLEPEARSVLDLGGQDSKAIALGGDGSVVDFLMNDKCAAGTGRFLTMTANLLEVDLRWFDALGEGETHPISSMCAVFAESEMVGLLASGVAKEALARGVLDSIASRSAGMLQRVAARGPVLFTGGLARCAPLLRMLERKTGLEFRSSEHSQTAGALGAAVLGAMKARVRRATVV